MDREPTLLDDFDIAEVDVITFPCAKCLRSGETLLPATITCEYLSGAPDATAAARCATPHQIVGTDVLQLVSGAQAGTWYHVRGVIPTNQGRVLVGSAIFQGKRL